MKSHSPLCLLALLLLSCLDREVKRISPADPSPVQTWCSSGRMSYQFEQDGIFTMHSPAGQTWAGHWSYAPTSSDIEINLRLGPNQQIKLIHLTDIRYTANQLTGNWSDEISRNLPILWKPCSTIPTPK